MSNQTERMRSIVKFIRRDAESLRSLAENAAERGIDPAQANHWAERFEAAAGQIEGFLEGWNDPRNDPDYRQSTVARAIERDRTERKNKNGN